MSFFKEVSKENVSRIIAEWQGVPALDSYLPNSLIYVSLYVLALPPNLLLAYMGLKQGLISSRVKYPTLGMTLANLFGLIGFLLLNSAYLFAVTTHVHFSLLTCSFLRTVLYNCSYVCYFLFPILAIDQYLYVCKNYEMKIRSLGLIIAICFAIPILVALYDLFLQEVILYDFMFLAIKMSPYTTVFFFFVLAPSFFIFSFVCNLLVLISILRRQSKSSRKQVGRTLNARQLQHYKGIVIAYIVQAFFPLVLATPYYIATLFLIFNVELDMLWFIIGEAIIGFHPLTNALITLLFLRPYRHAFRRLFPTLGRGMWKRESRYSSIPGKSPAERCGSSSVKDNNVQQSSETDGGGGANFCENKTMTKSSARDEGSHGQHSAMESLIDESRTVSSAGKSAERGSLSGNEDLEERYDSGEDVRL